MLPAETLDKKQNYKDSLSWKPFSVYDCLGKKQEITDSLSMGHLWQTVSIDGENWSSDRCSSLYTV